MSQYQCQYQCQYKCQYKCVYEGINYWLKSKLLDVTTPGVTEQFWLGAENEGRHSENAPGEWTWPHKGNF